MKPPLFVRPLTDPEQQALRDGLRRKDASTLRRCQILLAGAEGLRPAQIAVRFGFASQTARNAIRAFDAAGIDRVREGSHRPASALPEIDDAGCQRLRALRHRSPRDFAKPTSLWTLALAADVAYDEGITARPVSDETIRQALLRWASAGSGPRPGSPAPTRPTCQKKGHDRLIRLAATHPDWVLGYQDEV